jgi:HSP20 family molecular chaperone IbpA
MTTKTYVPGHIVSADRVLRQLPALFNDNWLNSVFGDFDKAFDVPNAVYPYNVVQVTNSAKEVAEYRVEVALAGVGKENIDVKVREGKLQINILYPREKEN